AGDSLREVARADLPTADADFRAVVFADADGAEHLALVLGDIAAEAEDVLVRVHSECLTGEALGSFRCDCGPQLAAARAAGAAAVWPPKYAPTGCRTTAWTPWTPTWNRGCPPTPGTTPARRRS